MQTLTRQQVRELDRRAVADYGVPSIVLMENAGRGVADILGSLGVAGPVVVCCGPGNNGGDGFVLARHLDLRGHVVRVLYWRGRGPSLERVRQATGPLGDAETNLRILLRSGVPVEERCDAATLADDLHGAAWVVDALLGTGVTGEPRPPLDGVIDAINASGVPVLAVDLPSGLDCDTGQPARHTIRATHTATFVAAKPGLVAASAAAHVGRLHVVDIGAPRVLVESLLRLGPAF